MSKAQKSKETLLTSEAQDNCITEIMEDDTYQTYI